LTGLARRKKERGNRTPRPWEVEGGCKRLLDRACSKGVRCRREDIRDTVVRTKEGDQKVHLETGACVADNCLWSPGRGKTGSSYPERESFLEGGSER